MELQQLQYVLALAEARSFTRAAERCSVVQSALSHQIKALEDELGFRLFERTSRRVDITAAGAAFLPAAQESLRAAGRAMERAREVSGLICGSLRIGITPDMGSTVLPPILSQFHGRYPQVTLTLRTCDADILLELVEAGDLDVALLELEPESIPGGFSSIQLSRDQAAAVMIGNHALSQRPQLRLQDLSDEEFVDFPLGTLRRARNDSFFQAAHVPRTVNFEVTTISSTLELVGQGLAVSVAPSRLVRKSKGLKVATLAEVHSYTESLVWREFNSSAACQAFLGTVGMQLEIDSVSGLSRQS